MKLSSIAVKVICYGLKFLLCVLCQNSIQMQLYSLPTVYIQELSKYGLLSFRAATGCHQYHVLWNLYSWHRWRLYRRTIWSVQKWNGNQEQIEESREQESSSGGSLVPTVQEPKDILEKKKDWDFTDKKYLIEFQVIKEYLLNLEI